MASNSDLDAHLAKCIELLYQSKNLRKGDKPPLQKVLEDALFEEYGIKKDYTAFFQSQLPPREGSVDLAEGGADIAGGADMAVGGADIAVAGNFMESNNENLPPTNLEDTLDSVTDFVKENYFESLLLDDLLCVKCQKMNIVVNNDLLECTECHKLYHQQCHEPRVRKYKKNWVCSDCQNLKATQSVSKKGKKKKALKERNALPASSSISVSPSKKASSFNQYSLSGESSKYEFPKQNYSMPILEDSSIYEFPKPSTSGVGSENSVPSAKSSSPPVEKASPPGEDVQQEPLGAVGIPPRKPDACSIRRSAPTRPPCGPVMPARTKKESK